MERFARDEMRDVASVVSPLALVVLAALVGTGSASAASTALTRVAPMSLPALEPLPVAPEAPALAVPAALMKSGLDLRAGPLALPLELRISSIGVTIPIIGVGITANQVMDAPMGPPSDPVWQEAFWYRGSAVPGAASTALIAGHINDPLGRPGSFAHLDQLRRGDKIVVRDMRNGLIVRFAVTSTRSYPLDQTSDRAVLIRMYGAGPVSGNVPQPSTDGLAHLTLVTCAGTFQHDIGTHDHRLVVSATRIA
jgi:sortase (surface protein transpeptidase)